MACIPPNPKRVGYIDPIHGPLDGPLYMGSRIHQQKIKWIFKWKSFDVNTNKYIELIWDLIQQYNPPFCEKMT